MTIQQLEYIVALDTYRHFITAAEKCFVTQPTLTMQVQKLEKEIGVLIFDRTKKPLQPTKAGEQILVRVRQILWDIKALKEYINEETETLTGSYRLGIIPTLAPYLVPRFLPDFLKNNPKLELEIFENQTTRIIDNLINEKLDIALVVTPLDEKRLREIPLFYEPFLVYAAPEHEISKLSTVQADLQKYDDILLLEEGHCFRNQTLNICKHDRNHKFPGLSYQSGSIETLKNMVKKGMGYTLIPELSIIEGSDSPYIRKFSGDQPVREVSIVVHQSFTKERLIEVLRESILKNVPDSFKRKSNYIRIKWR